MIVICRQVSLGRSGPGTRVDMNEMVTHKGSPHSCSEWWICDYGAVFSWLQTCLPAATHQPLLLEHRRSGCSPDPWTRAQLLYWHLTEAVLPSHFAVGHRCPPARSGHRCVADNANLYVFGGYNPDYDESGGPENEDYPLFRELWRYNFATDTWHQMGTEGYMPRELASMSRTYGNSIPMRLLLKLF